jgi:hypothetical protein
MYHVTIFEWNNITLNTSRFIKPRYLAISTYVPAAKKGTRLIMSTRVYIQFYVETKGGTEFRKVHGSEKYASQIVGFRRITIKHYNTLCKF